jgi:hypothetical protein
MTGRTPTHGRQIPTRMRLLRVFHRNYIRQGYQHCGCIRDEDLCNRFGGAARFVIEDLVRDGTLQRRNCGALAYELVPAERSNLGQQYRLASRWEHKRWMPHSDQFDLADLGSSPTSEQRCAAAQGVSLEVYRLQNRLRQLPVRPHTVALQNERELVARALIQAARRANCVPRINLMAGTIAE